MNLSTRPLNFSSIESLEGRRLCAIDLEFGLNPGKLYDVAGEALPIKGTVIIRNGGDTATAGPVPYRVVLTTNSEVTENITVLGNGMTDTALAAGGEALINFEYPVPTNLLGDERAIGVLIDPDNAVAETNEGNNAATDSSAIRFATTIVGSQISGTSGDDTMILRQLAGAFVLTTLGPTVPTFRMGRVSDVTRLSLDLSGGNDGLRVESGNAFTVPLDVDAGTGNDSVVGGNGDDVLAGGAGNDRIDGGLGADHLIGGPQSDHLRGQDGEDTVSGNGGRDFLAGNAGADSLVGGPGDDVLTDRGGADVDILSGNSGRDSGESDVSDLLASIEVTIA